MFLLSCEGHFDSAHFLADYDGECANIHGHRWRVVVYIQREELIKTGQERGMVLDFSHLKKDVKNLVDKFDHALIIEQNSMKKGLLLALKEEGFAIIETEFRPTAEEFSRYFANKLQAKGYLVRKVEVYETPTNMASYEV